MDLGFGNSNQVLGNQASASILATARAQEAAISSEISKYDALLDSNDGELEKLREKRLAAMKNASEQRRRWIENGHGTYDELRSGQHGGDIAKSFFDAAKKSSRLVVHFHRPTTRSCDAFHRALSELAPKHPETRFLKLNVEGCDDVREGGSGAGAKFLVERLGVVVMPTLLIVKDQKVTHELRGFDELGGREEFSSRDLAFVLGGHGALTRREEEESAPSFMEESGGSRGGMLGVNSLRMQFGGGSRGPRSGGYDDFDDDE
mmetsp:Transcript_21779/g.47395  ORF Transcript_21779/g.47395 Transcript_21779/m.47395 type:complete len:262 (-) Transcript_21779:319-1104(-)